MSLNHPGIDLVDHMRYANANQPDTVKIKLQNDLFSLKNRLETTPQSDVLPGDIMELHILEVANAYARIEDFGDADALKALKHARLGLSEDGKTPLASLALRQQLGTLRL